MAEASSILAADHWHNDKVECLRFDYPLDEESLVFDVGGYRGDWAHGIAEKYNPYIYIFEPIPQFYSFIKQRFQKNEKVTAYNLGLLDKRRVGCMSVNEDCSSLYFVANDTMMVPFVDLGGCLDRLSVKHVDLIKINIEGAEYPLLRHMIDLGLVPIFQNILIQFHSFYPDAEEIRREIRVSLEETHLLTFDYPFVWESWRKQ